MRLNFSKGFLVKGDIDKVFDLTLSFLSGMNFRTDSSVKPTVLVLKRGDAFGSLTSIWIENHKTTLTISFSQKRKNVNVLCAYDVQGYGVFYTSGHKSKLAGEVEKLKEFLQTSLYIT